MKFSIFLQTLFFALTSVSISSQAAQTCPGEAHGATLTHIAIEFPPNQSTSYHVNCLYLSSHFPLFDGVLIYGPEQKILPANPNNWIPLTNNGQKILNCNGSSPSACAWIVE